MGKTPHMLLLMETLLKVIIIIEIYSEIFPAIDLKDNKCVRLDKRQRRNSQVFNSNPIDQAKYFEGFGVFKTTFS